LGTPRPTPVLTLAELETRLTDFFLNEYHQRLHGETGVTPQARWEAGGFLPRHPDTLEQLDLLLLTMPRTRRIHQDGVHCQGFRYIDLTLAAYVGEQVSIRYDPRDLAEIRVYHQERFLCRAVCQEWAGQTISLQEVIRARNARRRQLREHIGARTSIADQLLPRPRPQVQPNAPAPMPSKLKRYCNE
jgi:putative transposase